MIRCLKLGFIDLRSVLSMRRHVELSADPFKLDQAKLRADFRKVVGDLAQRSKRAQNEQFI